MMMKIHLNRDRESLGQFSPEAVAEGLLSGRFKPTDLAWKEGMESWKPLGEWTDLPPAPPATATAQVSLAPLASESSTTDLVDSSSTEIQPAWESKTPQPTLTRIVNTVKDTLGHPGATFSSLSKSGNILRPFWFILFIASITNIVQVGYQLAFALADPESFKQQAPEFPMEWLVPAFVLVMFFMPFIVAAIAFISAGLYHLGLMLTGSAKEGFATTFRVSCYVQGSTSVFQLLPFFGQYIQLVWNVVGLVIGLQKAHKIGLVPAIIAVILPGILFCGCLIAVLMLGVGAAVAGAPGAAQ